MPSSTVSPYSTATAAPCPAAARPGLAAGGCAALIWQPRLRHTTEPPTSTTSPRPVVMKGTITKFEWLNPHNQIYFDVTDEKGVVSHWIAATEPPQVMLERGWTTTLAERG